MTSHFRPAAVIAALCACATAGGAHAASGSTASATGSATATIVTPIVLTHVPGATLSFGLFQPNAGGTVVVTPSGTGTMTGSVSPILGLALVSADQFIVTGDRSRSFAITTSASAITNGTMIMPFTPKPSATTATTSPAGTYSFTVGGTLTVAANDTPGTYMGTYNATVAYN